MNARPYELVATQLFNDKSQIEAPEHGCQCLRHAALQQTELVFYLAWLRSLDVNTSGTPPAFFGQAPLVHCWFAEASRYGCGGLAMEP